MAKPPPSAAPDPNSDPKSDYKFRRDSSREIRRQRIARNALVHRLAYRQRRRSFKEMRELYGGLRAEIVVVVLCVLATILTLTAYKRGWIANDGHQSQAVFLSAIVIPVFIVLVILPNLSQSHYRIGDLATAEAAKLQENLKEDFFTKLVQINFKYIEAYYSQTQEQANKSFRLSAGAAVLSLCVVITGIVMMFGGKLQAAYVTAGAGVLSEFIAAIFFYLYNRTVLKMSQYHQKLVLTQNIGLALKITEGLPDAERAKAQVLLIEALSKDINKHLSDIRPDAV